MIQKLRLMQRAHRYRTRHDPAEIAEIHRRLSPGCVALDLGAHKGAYTYWMSRWTRPGGRVIAVEPQPMLAERLAGLFRSQSGVTVLHGAVGETAGTITLRIPGESGPSHGATIREVDQQPEQPMREIEVPCYTLESIAADCSLDRLDFIKCDTEGAERSIFAGGSAVLERFKPTVLVECEKRHSSDDDDPVGELWSTFESLGYAGFCFCGGRRVPISEFDYSTHQSDPDDKPNYGNNFLFTHQAGPAHQGGGCQGGGCACGR